MATLLLYVQRIISYVLEILGIVQAVQAGQNAQATAAGVAALEAEVKDIQLKVNDSVIGLAAIRDQTDLIYTALTAATGTIEADLATLTGNIGEPVVVGELGAGVADIIANAVWAWPVPDRLQPAYQYLNQAGDYANAKGAAYEEIRSPAIPAFWTIGGIWGYDDQGQPDVSIPFALDLSTILPSDATSYDWLLRTIPDAGWFQDAAGRAYLQPSGSGFFDFIVDLDTLKWFQLKQMLGLTGSSINVPPVWPGLDNVVLGDPVDISLSFTVDGPMDGVLVALATYPTLKGQYTYDDMVSALKIGALAFVSDNGDAEFIQGLGFLNEVYCPKSMVRATSCKVRTVDGVTGTITPWTLV